jgi:hypothetical protein
VNGLWLLQIQNLRDSATGFYYFCCDQSLCTSEVESRLGPRNPEVGLCGTKQPERYKVVWTCKKHDVFETVGILWSLYLIVNYHELPMNLHIIELRCGACLCQHLVSWNRLKSVEINGTMCRMSRLRQRIFLRLKAPVEHRWPLRKRSCNKLHEVTPSFKKCWLTVCRFV